MRYKVWKFCENRARDTILRGVYIPHFGQICVKISILGVLHRCRCTDRAEIWHGGGGPFLRAGDLQSPPSRGPSVPSSVPNFTPIGTTCPQCRAKIRTIGLTKLNTGRLALCAMLLVITLTTCSLCLIAHSACSLDVTLHYYKVICGGRQHHLDVALLLSFEWINLNNNRYN